MTPAAEKQKEIRRLRRRLAAAEKERDTTAKMLNLTSEKYTQLTRDVSKLTAANVNLQHRLKRLVKLEIFIPTTHHQPVPDRDYVGVNLEVGLFPQHLHLDGGFPAERVLAEALVQMVEELARHAKAGRPLT